MWRLFVFLVAVAALGFLFAWFADRPGEVTLVWQGLRYQTSLMVVIAALAALVAVILAVWWIVATVLRSPALMRRFLRNRRRDRGYYALSQGLIAAGSGDAASARRLSRESRRLLGSEPLVELLDAQTLLLEHDHEAARTRFEKMLEDDDTRLVALRGLYLEAEREGAREAARHYAEEAARLSPALAWAGMATLRHQSAEGDWQGALAALERLRSAGAVAKEEAQRKRAVLLTAQAMAEAQAAPDKAAKLAREAHRLAEELVPAATVAAAALARTGDYRRAAAILETTWKGTAHPEIAEAYVHLRGGDSARDRLKRARKLAAMRPDEAAGRLAVAEAAIAAHDWQAAREAMRPVLAEGPSQRACLLMAEIEEGEHGDRGRVRDWLARAVRAPRDPVWTADGHVSAHWLPVSPVSGRLDAFEWKVPAIALGAPADLDLAAAELAERDESVETAVVEAEPAEAAAPAPAEAGSAAPGPRVPAAKAAEPTDEEVATVLPLERPPDDPGVEPEEKAAAEEKAFRLF
ncbi:MAG: heme biosynthesis protein HemY [Alphaproteobacteria bacterium]|nr:MAG: heme biosynthesis protein HemY [Alphaproteobacteria bacterium]